MKWHSSQKLLGTVLHNFLRFIIITRFWNIRYNCMLVPEIWLLSSPKSNRENLKQREQSIWILKHLVQENETPDNFSWKFLHNQKSGLSYNSRLLPISIATTRHHSCSPFLVAATELIPRIQNCKGMFFHQFSWIVCCWKILNPNSFLSVSAQSCRIPF